MFKAITSSMVFLSLIQISATARAQGTNTSKIKVDSGQETPHKWNGEWQLELGGDDFAEGKDEGLAAVMFFKTSFEYNFSPWLRASIKPRIDF
jgi:hypothetical protein